MQSARQIQRLQTASFDTYVLSMRALVLQP